MSKTKSYKQCTLLKQTDNGTLKTVSWIPSEYAVLGNRLKLKTEEGYWVDGWLVFEIGHEKPAELVESDETLYRRHRKTTDVKKGTFK
jgi:hypothetical protein